VYNIYRVGRYFAGFNRSKSPEFNQNSFNPNKTIFFRLIMKTKCLKSILFLIASIYALGNLSQVIAADTTNYTIVIKVSSTKPNGNSWDVGGGAPDIVLEVEDTRYSTTRHSSKRCEDTYKCEMSFSSKNSKWYLEIYDKDVKVDDLIGKGECQANNTCTLGKATVTIQ
jgi:hypothetical protein